MSISPAFMDELRSRLTLSDIIGRKVSLKRAGREFKGCCPFHNEKSPSFYVNDQKQFYHCFGCGAHGDAIGFMMAHDNLSFIESIEGLAAQAGMEVPKPTPEARAQEERKKDLHALMEDATKLMQAELFTSSNKDVLDYLTDRGITQESIQSFRLGYAPEGGNVIRQKLLDLKYTDEQMIEAGLVKPSSKGGSPYFFFRDRVMFPVADRRGRVVAFGGRVLPENIRPPTQSDFKPPKYLNSPDTPLFHKGRMLYGESHARQAAIDGHTPVVVEGYMDVIACYQAGLRGAVAPLGTALTEDQGMLLWKMIIKDEKIPVLCFDGDNAGRRAALRACERLLPLLKPNHSVALAFLPEGEDPDTYIKRKSKNALVEVLRTALPLSEFLWQIETQGKNFATPEARAGLSEALEKRTNQIADRTVQTHYRQIFRDRVWQSFGRSSYKGGKSNQRGQRVENKVSIPTPAKETLFQRCKDGIIATCLNHPRLIMDFMPELEAIEDWGEGKNELMGEVLLWVDGEENPDEPLDNSSLKTHLVSSGFEQVLSQVLNEHVFIHTSFARPHQDDEKARKGMQDLLDRLSRIRLESDLMLEKKRFVSDFTTDSQDRLQEMQRLLGKETDS